MPAPSAACRQAAPIDDRTLDWDGCFNARDLGGPPVAGGRVTRPGALVRADSLAGLTAAGVRVALGSEDDGPVLDAFLAERGTTGEALVLDLLAGVDLAALLRAGGLTDEDLAALRARLLAPAEAVA